MKITERLQTVTKLFLDTAPVVYYVQDLSGEKKRRVGQAAEIGSLLGIHLRRRYAGGHAPG
jgi:hypothetical protein